jgi:hypothetical protein
MEGDVLDERCWEHIRSLVERTGTDTRTWMGFAWTGKCEVRCELQIDDGYDGVFVRVEVSESVVAEVEAAIKRAMRGWAEPARVAPPPSKDGVQPPAIRPPGPPPKLSAEQIKRLGQSRRPKKEG